MSVLTCISHRLVNLAEHIIAMLFYASSDLASTLLCKPTISLSISNANLKAPTLTAPEQ